MAVYRFRVCLEDNEDVYRDIDIKAAQSFDLFHDCIQEAFKFDKKHAASFFVSDDYWRKNEEITLNKEDLALDEEDKRRKIERKYLMKETKIAKFIEQPHQRFVYVFDPEAQWCFLIEMLKIVNEDAKLSYPVCIRTAGNAPKQYKTLNIIKDDLTPEMALAAILSEDSSDEEAYKTLDTGEEGIEDDDLVALEGEEGEDEADSEEGEDSEGGEDMDPSAFEEDEH
ncbi:MAG: hypothetical protein KBG47_12715 [Bacteroidia bacterium]|nr:hypothetical protein [Sphingobacteriaceae bacterium]MBP9070365.1 hypothetical protein [Bacteroidia bacterium]